MILGLACTFALYVSQISRDRAGCGVDVWLMSTESVRTSNRGEAARAGAEAGASRHHFWACAEGRPVFNQIFWFFFINV